MSAVSWVVSRSLTLCPGPASANVERTRDDASSLRIWGPAGARASAFFVPVRNAKGNLLRVLHDFLIDGAKDGAAGFVHHLDAHAVAECEKRRSGPAFAQRLDRAQLGEACVSRTALLNGLARAASELVGDGA